MHIIFGKEHADQLEQKYTVLELDTFQLGENGPTITAYCTVENVPFQELSNLEQQKIQHQHLLINYRGRVWNDCLEAVDSLTGKWGGELDSFYQDLAQRIKNYLVNPPPANWSPVIVK